MPLDEWTGLSCGGVEMRVTRGVVAGAGMVASLCLAGCAQSTVARAPAPLLLVKASTPTPQVQVGFVVATSTPVPAAPTCPIPWVRPAPLPSSGPALQLGSSIGPPVERSVSLLGQHLPPRTDLTAVWMTDRGATPISTTIWTDARGTMHGTFHIPASQPGAYRIGLLQSGFLLTSAPYRVYFGGGISASIRTAASTQTVRVHGTCFQRHVHLALLAYRLNDVMPPTTKATRGRNAGKAPRPRPILLGDTRTDTFGTVSFMGTAHLPPGQYHIETVSLDSSTLQLADTVANVNQ